MSHPVARGLALLALAGCGALGAVSAAADPLGFYLGAGLGRANVKVDELGFSEHATGWKALVGLRPIPLLGAEMEYVDFGNPSISRAGLGSVGAKSRGAALFGLVYAPLPLPLLDLYAKAGLARLQSTADGQVAAPCGLGIPNCGLFRLDRTDTRFAYGAGAQVKIATLAVRLEYEQFSSRSGDPNFASVSLTWGF